MFTTKQLQERYGVSEPTVLGWINSGQLVALNVAKTAAAKRATWRITPEALAAFEAARAATPAPERKQRKRAPEGVVEFYK